MLDKEESRRHLWSALQGVSRGLALSLGMMVAMDVVAAGDVTGRLRLGLAHPPFMACLIATLLVVAGLLELERGRRRLVRRYGAER